MSRLRITGGRAGGRVLKVAVPPGVRPTTERVREALFSIIGQDLHGTTLLDAFGGAGLVGLEAWSRGAEVTVVERDRRALAALRQRGEELGADWKIVAGDVLKRASDLGTFDGVFADPPYAHDVAAAVAVLAPLARHWLVAETSRSAALPDRVRGLSLDRQRAYGETLLWCYRAS